jgi:hypothetical protein
MGRRLFASYYLYYACNDAAATTSVANQLLKEHLMLSIPFFTYMLLLTPMCLNMLIVIEPDVKNQRPRYPRDVA